MPKGHVRVAHSVTLHLPAACPSASDFTSLGLSSSQYKVPLKFFPEIKWYWGILEFTYVVQSYLKYDRHD